MTVGFAEGLKATNAGRQAALQRDRRGRLRRRRRRQARHRAAARRRRRRHLRHGRRRLVRHDRGDRRAQRQANADAPAWFIDVIGDKTAEHGDVLLTSVLFDYTGIYEQMIDDLDAGTFGKIYTMDVENGGVRLLDLPEDVAAGRPRTRSPQPRSDIVDGTIDGLRPSATPRR